MSAKMWREVSKFLRHKRHYYARFCGFRPRSGSSYRPSVGVGWQHGVILRFPHAFIGSYPTRRILEKQSNGTPNTTENTPYWMHARRMFRHVPRGQPSTAVGLGERLLSVEKLPRLVGNTSSLSDPLPPGVTLRHLSNSLSLAAH